MRHLASIRPDKGERTFLMADLCKRAEEEYLHRNAGAIRKRAEQDEVRAEVHSRMAAGEPSLLIGKFQVARQSQRERESFLGIMPFILGAFAFDNIPFDYYPPVTSRYVAPHRVGGRRRWA
jgi:hypothetical protein